jgi:Protein of unknown function (DUF2905)
MCYLLGMNEAGRLVLGVGIVLVVAGALLMLLGRLHLPGDLLFRRGGVTVYVPLATSLILSVALTLLLNVLLRGR